jgi:Tol biopolymer transport system component
MFVYLSGKTALIADYSVLWIDKSGKAQPLIATPANYLSPRISPDGKRLALSIGQGKADIWLYDLEREAPTKLTFTENNHAPVWTRDGKHIAYFSESKGIFSIMCIRSDGVGEPQRLWESKTFLAPWSFSPDGRRLAFQETSPETRADLWTLPLDTSDPDHPKPGKPELFLRSPANESAPVYSPDGRWMAYASNQSGPDEIFRSRVAESGRFLLPAA